MRFLLHVLLLVPFSFVLAYWLTCLSGRIWLGFAGGVLGVGLVGAIFGSLDVTGWLNLGETPYEAGLMYLQVFGWNVGLIAALPGIIFGLIRRGRDAERKSELQKRT